MNDAINRLIKELENNLDDYGTMRSDYLTHTLCRRSAIRQAINLLKEYEKKCAEVQSAQNILRANEPFI